MIALLLAVIAIIAAHVSESLAFIIAIAAVVAAYRGDQE